MEFGSSSFTNLTEFPVSSEWLTAKCEVGRYGFRWEIPDIVAQMRPGWSCIQGPEIRCGRADVVWRLEMAHDREGFLYVGIELCLQMTVNWSNRTYTPTTPPTSFTASIYDALEPEACAAAQVPRSFKNCVDYHQCKLMKSDDVLSNPARYFPDGQLTIMCTVFEEGRTIIPDQSKKPSVHVPPPEMTSCMGNALSEQLFSDVVLVVDGKLFPAHQVILAQRSDVFKAMFQTDMTESRDRRVIIEDLSADAVGDLLTFIYTDSAPNIGELAPELLAAAEKYNIARLKAVCEEELSKHLDATNVLDKLVLSDVHRAVQLQKAALHWIAENSADVMTTQSWKTLCETHPQAMKPICEMFAAYIERFVKPPKNVKPPSDTRLE